MAEHSRSNLTMIWGNDGWCYIPQRNIRRKFTEDASIQEAWTGVIAMPEHIETISVESYETTFPLKTSNPDNHKKPQRRSKKSQ